MEIQHGGQMNTSKLVALVTMTVTAVTLLAGCAPLQPPAPEATISGAPPRVVQDPNVAACDALLDASDRLQVIVTDTTTTQGSWAEFGADLDRVGLSAEGTVRDRILALTENWPRLSDVMFGDTRLTEDWTAALRACEPVYRG